MKFKRRIMGILLAAAIIVGGVGMNGSVAQAKDLMDQTKYCTYEQYRQLAIVDSKAQKITQLLNQKIVGCHDSGSSWKGTEDTRYWVTDGEINAFWVAARKYLFPVSDSDEARLHNWGKEDLLKPVDKQGVSNWKEIDGVTYLTSIDCDEAMEVINQMNAVIASFQSILQAEWARENNSKDSKGSGHSHTHNYVETTVSEATETADRVVALECTICGQQQSHVTLLGSAVNEFIKDTVAKLEKAPANGSVTIDTEIWTCFNRTVIEALKNRQDVEVTVNFTYKNDKYTFTIPAGYGAEQLDALPDENGYCGFMYLLSVFNGHSL